MADLQETVAVVDELDAWVQGIYQLEQEDLVLGGPDGIDNLQAKQLLARSNWLKTQILGLGAGKQPLDPMLTALAALVTAADQTLYFTGPDAPALTALTAYARTLLAANDAAAARVVLDAASPADVDAAIAALVNSSPATLDTLNELAAALGNDENFAATMTAALALKAALESPAFTGNPTAPTQALFNSSTRLASTAFVKANKGGLAGLSGYAVATQLTTADVNKLTEINAGVVITLPAANTVPNGEAVVLRATSNGASVTRYGADVIYTGDGVNSVNSWVLNKGDTLTLISNGANAWYASGGSVQLKYAGVFAALSATNGYQPLPSGIIFQWGFASATTGGNPVTFPIAFPTACLYAGPGIASTSSIPAATSPTTTGFTFYANTGSSSHFWLAIGK